jgi:hypothetical protein
MAWTLQFWMPQVLEILSVLIPMDEFSQVEFALQLFALFRKNTITTVYLLTGDYLNDPYFIRMYCSRNSIAPFPQQQVKERQAQWNKIRDNALKPRGNIVAVLSNNITTQAQPDEAYALPEKMQWVSTVCASATNRLCAGHVCLLTLEHPTVATSGCHVAHGAIGRGSRCGIETTGKDIGYCGRSHLAYETPSGCHCQCRYAWVS